MKQFILLLCIVCLGIVTCTGEGTSLDQTLLLGSPFELSCDITTDTELNITWSKDGKPIDKQDDDDRYTIFENNTLQVKSAKDQDAGIYTCTVQPTGEQRTITVKNKPRALIINKGKSKTVVQGDTLELVCEMKGYPLPDATWYRGEVEILRNDSRVTFKLETQHDDGVEERKSTLSITDMQEADRAEYKCLARNSADQDSAELLVRVKDKLAALWPFLGIVAEVAILCTIIFIYERRRSKQELEESDTDQSPETKNASDNKDKDVRQRK